MADLETRVRELEQDLPESEGRVMELIGELKSDIRHIRETQELHAKVMIRLLRNGRDIFDPERQSLEKKLRSRQCEHCS